MTGNLFSSSYHSVIINSAGNHERGKNSKIINYTKIKILIEPNLKFVNIFTPDLPRPKHAWLWDLIDVFEIISNNVCFLQFQNVLNWIVQTIIICCQSTYYSHATWRNRPIELERYSGAKSSEPEAWKSLDKPSPTSPAT